MWPASHRAVRPPTCSTSSASAVAKRAQLRRDAGTFSSRQRTRRPHAWSKDRETMLAFYDFPAEHWGEHLRTDQPHRLRRSKGCLSNKTALAMVSNVHDARRCRLSQIVVIHISGGMNLSCDWVRPTPVLSGRRSSDVVSTTATRRASFSRARKASTSLARGGRLKASPVGSGRRRRLDAPTIGERVCSRERCARTSARSGLRSSCWRS